MKFVHLATQYEDKICDEVVFEVPRDMSHLATVAAALGRVFADQIRGSHPIL